MTAMKHTASIHFPHERVTLAPRALGAGRLLAAAGLILLTLTTLWAWWRENLDAFYHAYLYNFCFFLSISLGALFFVMIQHAARTGWSVTVRRLAEVLAGVLPWSFVFFLPILLPVLLGSHALYPWTDHQFLLEHEGVQHKVPYLNVPFFAVRAVLYFVVWGLLARWFLRASLAQDETGDPAATLRMERTSYVGLILFGVTVTFAAFDWMMSLEPEWFSTIFGLYYFAGAAVAGLAAVILAAVLLQAGGRLVDLVTVEHYHDLGKYLLAFVIFWGYMAFSQYMLIWYANMPEETFWFLQRQQGPWLAVSLAVLFGNLLVPFVVLLSRHVKRRKWLLAAVAVWLLAFHWLDVLYLVVPSRDAAASGGVAGIMDVACLLGLGAAFLGGVAMVVGQRSLVAQRDPRVGEAVAFENY